MMTKETLLSKLEIRRDGLYSNVARPNQLWDWENFLSNIRNVALLESVMFFTKGCTDIFFYAEDVGLEGNQIRKLYNAGFIKKTGNTKPATITYYDPLTYELLTKDVSCNEWKLTVDAKQVNALLDYVLDANDAFIQIATGKIA